MAEVFASKCPFLHFLLLLIYDLVLGLGGQIHEHQGIVYQTLLYLQIKRSVGGKAGRVVDLQYLRLQIVVQYHIKPQYLEAHVICIIVWLARSVMVGQERLG